MTMEPHESDSVLELARPCVVCGRPIKLRRRQRYCGRACRAQDLRAGPRRFAYADPPYPGNSLRLYGDHPDYAGEVDHRELVERLVDEFPDGWALSTGASNLHHVLPLCPGDVRVMAWVKPLLSMKPTASVQFGWEPVIVKGGRPRHPDDGLIRDWVSVSPPRHKELAGGLIGMKPRAFCYWLFDVLNVQLGDELVDLFPGSGAVTEAWRAYLEQPRLPFPRGRTAVIA
jgi:hypothetical protein